MWLQIRWRDGRYELDSYRWVELFPSRCQHPCSTGGGKILVGRDGINKTMVWKKYGWKKSAPLGNFADAETFPTRHAGAICQMGLF
jgi:hypothetical protein